MVYIIRPIDIISHSDNKHYTSMKKYEKSLDDKGQHIMSDREYKQLREKVLDTEGKREKPKPMHNHIHIDVNNGRFETSINKDVQNINTMEGISND